MTIEELLVEVKRQEYLAGVANGMQNQVLNQHASRLDTLETGGAGIQKGLSPYILSIGAGLLAAMEVLQGVGVMSAEVQTALLVLVAGVSGFLGRKGLTGR